MSIKTAATQAIILKFFLLKFILRLFKFTFFFAISACSIASVDLGEQDLELRPASSQSVTTFPVDIIAPRHGENNNINDLDLGKALKKTIDENLYIFSSLDIKKLNIYVYVHDRRKIYNFGPLAPALLPLIEESKLVVSWSADLRDGSSKEILEKSITFKTYTHIIFIPYGLVATVIRPFNGNWIGPLGFWANFIDGEGAILSNAIEINKSMVKAFSSDNTLKDVTIKKN